MQLSPDYPIKTSHLVTNYLTLRLRHNVECMHIYHLLRTILIARLLDKNKSLKIITIKSTNQYVTHLSPDYGIKIIFISMLTSMILLQTKEERERERVNFILGIFLFPLI